MNSIMLFSSILLNIIYIGINNNDENIYLNISIDTILNFIFINFNTYIYSSNSIINIEIIVIIIETSDLYIVLFINI